MTALLKHPIARAGQPGEGCWAFDNTEYSSSISGKFYGLVVSDRHAPQLDDLRWYEEVEFWRLNIDLARGALDRLDRETGDVHTALLGVNDGYYAGQSIPHVHSHIVVTEQTDGVEDFFIFHDMDRAMDSLRRAFCPAASPPQNRSHIICDMRDVEDFTWKLKYRREALREKGLDVFRLYTASPLRPDFKQIFFTLDATNADNPLFSFSQAWRAMHGRMPYEKLATPLGRGQYTHFEPAPQISAA